MEQARAWVYLVEDDPAIAEMYRVGLEMHGFRVSTAGCGEELFRSLDSTAPDVVVLDYHLPGANGAEVLEMIRHDDRTVSAKVFMLSGFPESADGVIDRVIMHGALAWFEKSKTPPTVLAKKLSTALGADTAYVD